MSSSQKGPFAWKSKAPRPETPGPEAWQPTRAHPPLNANAPPLEEWEATRALSGSARPAKAPEAWQSTRAQTALATQFLKDEEEYLNGEKADIGRQTGANE